MQCVRDAWEFDAISDRNELNEMILKSKEAFKGEIRRKKSSGRGGTRQDSITSITVITNNMLGTGNDGGSVIIA